MIKKLYKIFKNQGFKYVFFRSQYELKRKTGLLKNKFPSEIKGKSFISLEDWKKLNIPFLFDGKESIKINCNPNINLKESFNKIINGEIRYFNKDWKKTKDWLINPSTEYKYDIKKHWTEVDDFSSETGDIKYVWEKSRFSYLHDVIRYDYHFDKDHSKFVFDEIESWIDSNPMNMGPNYKCSQEISLRVLNWTFALNYYKDSSYLTEQLWNKLVQSCYGQIKHVYDNINFSRICVRNNHAITECMMLYFSGLLFPFYKESKTWKSRGKKWLEKEIQYQIYDDGTFLQFSHNYHRVLLQLLTFTIAVSKIYNEKLESKTLAKCKQTVHYMKSVCFGENGELPNYGNNDGALFFKLNNQEYTDFRPQINALNKVLFNTFLFDSPELTEDGLWFSNNIDNLEDKTVKSLNQDNFQNGGIYLIKDEEEDSQTFFKCASYSDRPAHADNMHLDLWYNGHNYLRDSGTFKYNTSEDNINYFSGNLGHNNVMIGEFNQMTKGPRFIWFDWTKETKVVTSEMEDKYIIEAKAKMFNQLGKDIIHKRKVVKLKGQTKWIIEDEILNKPKELLMKQLWHPNPDFQNKIKIYSKDNSKDLSAQTEKGYWSAFYSTKVEVPLVFFESVENKILTTIELI